MQTRPAPHATLSRDTLARLAPRPSGAARRAVHTAYLDAFTSERGCAILARFGLSGALTRLVAFVAQAAHETGGFTVLRESLTYTSVARLRAVWPSRTRALSDTTIRRTLLRNPVALGDFAYGGRMGNRKGTSDGYDFRGGGVFQITGRDGYRRASGDAGVDLEAHPATIEDPYVSLTAACATWQRLGCNALADAGAFIRIGRGINRGNIDARSAAVGEAERIALWRTLQALTA
ncbi:hypothetical protein NPA31_017985 [Aurantimonas sp. MSK8Z-1]|uniref:glycoside hydrolase family 19 protein n=1 Tax=Mangrovibrevibacter kandeliae TaxID=2968473 RepID=UPI002118BA12|nr:hypothetical protein [Aurantimonas sp. MSK8Z-1]MCW4116853.1 hypothetical protein [Aurantimonas sp. MSK8Z-1]